MKYKNLFSCRDKVAVVTGGAGLIGREIVKALAANGATVYVADNDIKKAKNIFSSRNIKFLHMDIISEDSVIKAFATVMKQAGRMDILVNSAYPRTKDWGKKLEDLPFESWKANLDGHLGGYFLCCRESARYMKRRGGGSIVNMGSIYGVVAPDFSIYEGTDMTMPAAYSAIKGGLINFTRYLASYYGKYKIRANVVSPGGIFSNQPRIFTEKYCKKNPLKRLGNASEVAGAVVYLAGDSASYVTGHNLIVDGGWTAW